MGIALTLGDITAVSADAVVNAANSRLLPGGGVCGAIHRAGGPRIAEECADHVARSGAVPTGSAAVTGAGALDARHVIHTVGPIWSGSGGEAGLLASAYRSAMRAADGLGLRSIAFPSISTGIFGYPVGEAAPVAIRAVREELACATHVREVVFVLFDPATFDAYARVLESEGGMPADTEPAQAPPKDEA